MLGFINKVIFLIPFLAFGSIQNDTIQKIDLENVIVKSTKINSNNKQIPLSVSVKNFKLDKNFNSQSSFSDFTRNIPGLFTTCHVGFV